MKRYTLSMADARKHTPDHPERTAAREAGTGLNFDIEFQVWPNRKAMIKTIARQGQRAPHHFDWSACKAKVERGL